jgi:hypothetical protein
MVIRTLFYSLLVFIISSLTITHIAQAANLTSYVDRKEVTMGESLSLTLEMTGATAKGSPDYEPLTENFNVYSQGQSTSTTIINGQAKTTMKWTVILLPQKTGQINIPALTLPTDQGDLKSHPIQITVNQTASPSADGTGGADLYMDVTTNTINPYMHEPVLLTAELISHKNISNVRLGELSIQDAIIEQHGDIKVYDRIKDGRRARVVQARYLITPLKQGKMTIPGFIFQGQVEDEHQKAARYSNSIQLGRDPFGLFDQLSGMTSYRPFMLTDDDIELDVRAPAQAMDPWLPLSSLNLRAQWEGLEDAKAGDPLTLTLSLEADGVMGETLPDLEAYIPESDHYKIYADTADLQNSIGNEGKHIQSRKIQSFTIIPQQAGTLTIPEIKIGWWNVKTDQAAYAKIPPQNISVKAGKMRSNPAAPLATPAKALPQVQEIHPQPGNQSDIPAFLYVVIAIMGAVILILAGAVFYLLGHKKTADQAYKAHANKAANEDKINVQAAETCEDLSTLISFIQTYAHQHWGMKRNTALRLIANSLEEKRAALDCTILRHIETAYYAGREDNVDMGTFRKDVIQLLKESQKHASGKGADDHETESFSRLNPS